MTKDRAMKPLTFLYMLVATAILSISCGERGRYAEPLLSAEQTVKSRPYDAIIMLEGRKDSLCRNEADSALYELVYAEALRGHGLQMMNAKYMLRSADFFRQCGDDDRTARALLQTALCYFDDGRYVDAAAKMKESELIATRLDDQDLRYRLFHALARLNDMAGSDLRSQRYYNLALAAAQSMNNRNSIAMTLNAMAERHLRQGRVDSFKLYIQRCEPLMDSIDAATRADVEATMGCFYLAKGDTARAKELFSRSQLVCSDRKSSLYLGDICAKEGDNDNAAMLWYDATVSSDAYIQKEALARLIARAKAQGNMEGAYYLSDMLNHVYASDISTATTAAIAMTQSNFDRQQTERSSKRTVLLLMTIAVVATIGTVAFVVLSRRRRKRKERSVSHWNMENRLLTADCVHQLHRLAATGKTASKADMDALHELVSQYDKPLVAVLSSNKNLLPVEIDLAMLTRLRFQPSEIATLTCSSSQNVTNTRARLLRKMFGKEGGAKDFDRTIREL